jgi:polyadenylate-binding protein
MSGVYGGPAGIDMDALIAAPPEQQKHMLSEVLLPRVQELHLELAGKIIGMLLEMDNNELINLYVFSYGFRYFVR